MTKRDGEKPGPGRYILRRQAIEAMPGTVKTHFLNANAKRINKSLGDATGLTGLGIHLIEVPPGAVSTEYHSHQFEDECVYVISGQCEVVLDEQRFALGAGDFVGLPAGGPAHVFENTGSEPLCCLVVGQRLTHDVGDYPRLNKRLYRNGDEWNLVDHGHIVEPKAQPGSRAGTK